MPLTVRDVLPPSGHEKNKRTEKLVDETGDGIALKHCQITVEKHNFVFKHQST